MSALAIESRTGVPDTFVRFLKVAVDKGFKKLSDLLLDAEMYATYVYCCGDCSRSFSQFQSAGVQSIMSNLIREVSVDQFAGAVHERVISFFDLLFRLWMHFEKHLC